MNETVAEVTNSLGAGILLFVAGVVQPIMDGMDAVDFKKFLNALGRTAMTNHWRRTVRKKTPGDPVSPLSPGASQRLLMGPEPRGEVEPGPPGQIGRNP